MRLWSLHPVYLDSKGLVALWREGLLAKKVLQGRTKGYKNHPQLLRFKTLDDSINAISLYLKNVQLEAKHRHYNFNADKLSSNITKIVIPVTAGQVNFEFRHLLDKLKYRDSVRYENLLNIDKIEVNPIFRIVPGGVEKWEKDKKTSR